MLHNTLAKNIDDEKISKQEWVFMLPNFLMFGAFGFAMALKKTKNQDILDLKVRELFEEMTETIYDLDEILLIKGYSASLAFRLEVHLTIF